MENQKSLIVTSYYTKDKHTEKRTDEFDNLENAFTTLKERENILAFSVSSVETSSQNGEKTVSEPKHEKDYIVALSKPLTKKELQQMGPHATILVTKMDQYGYSVVVPTPNGYIPVKKGTVVLDTNFNRIYPLPRVKQPTIER